MPNIRSRPTTIVLLAAAIFTLAISASGSNDWHNLVFVETVYDGAGGVVVRLDVPSSVAVSPDGSHVFVCGGYVAPGLPEGGSLALFTRNPATGELIFEESATDGVGPVDGILNFFALGVSPDGRNVYLAAAEDDAAAVFLVSFTGFFKADLPATELASGWPLAPGFVGYGWFGG